MDRRQRRALERKIYRLSWRSYHLTEDMAAEQKARTTYEHLIACTEDPCVKNTLRFLWEREVVHFQRFGETLNDVQCWMNGSKHVWTGHEMEK